MSKYTEEVKARAEKATPGRWDVFSGMVRHIKCELDDVVLEPTDTPVVFVGTNAEPIADCVVRDGETIISPNHEANAEFIAHAREDVPKLCERLEKAEKLLGAVEFSGGDHRFVQEIDDFLKEGD